MPGPRKCDDRGAEAGAAAVAARRPRAGQAGLRMTRSAWTLGCRWCSPCWADRSVDDVAQEWDVLPSLLHRWVGDFLVAGSGAITNQPDPDAARQRDRFMAALAHELRTPMAVARGWAETLEEGGLSEEMAAQSLRAAARRADPAVRAHRRRRARRFLVPRAHAGRLRARRRRRPLSARSPAAPEVRQGADLTVQADPALLEPGAPRPLVHRAPRARPDHVAIDVVETGSWHEIRVVREGNPISPMILRALFDPFDANDDATGVTDGLYLARALIVAHRGFLGAEGERRRHRAVRTAATRTSCGPGADRGPGP